MSFFSSLSSLTKAVFEEAKQLSTKLSLDNLQAAQGGGGEGSGGAGGGRGVPAHLDLTYLTPRLIAMGFPSTPDTKIRSRNDASAVAALLREAHGSGRAMVWNLSDESYDYALFDNQVVEVSCEGSPAPPLGLMVKVCAGIETWLAGDPANVAAIRACGAAQGAAAARAPRASQPLSLTHTHTRRARSPHTHPPLLPQTA